MAEWYQQLFRGVGLAATGAASGSFGGGNLGGLLGGIYGTVKAATGGASVGGDTYVRNLYQTAIPTAAAGALLYPSAQDALLKRSSDISGLEVAGGSSLISQQLSSLKGEIAGLGSSTATGIGGLASGSSDLFGNLLSGSGKALSSIGGGIGTLLSGQSPNAIANLFGRAPALGGITSPSLTSILGGGTPGGTAGAPVIVPVPANANTPAIQAGFPPIAIFLMVGAALFFFFKKGALK